MNTKVLSPAAEVHVEEQRRGLQYLFKLDKLHSVNKIAHAVEKQAQALLHRVAEIKIG